MIEKLSASGFKCLERLTVPLSRLTILTGENNAGKSSVVQGLLLLAQAQVQLRGALVGTVDLSGPLVDLGSFREILGHDAEFLQFSIRLDLQSSSAVWDFSPEEDPLIARCKASTFEKTLSNLSFVPADRFGPTDLMPLRPIAEQRFLGRDGGPGLVHLLRDEILEADDPRRHPDQEISLRLPAQVGAWLAELFPGVEYDLQPVLGIEFVRLAFKTDRKHEFRKPRHVGYGVSYALPIIVSVLAARPGSLLLIDSPEVHLHPRVQAQVGRLCALAAQAGVQVIVETHSEHVLNAARIQVRHGALAAERVGVLYFGRGIDPILLSLDSSGAISEWPRGFFDEAQRQLGELL